MQNKNVMTPEEKLYNQKKNAFIKKIGAMEDDIRATKSQYTIFLMQNKILEQSIQAKENEQRIADNQAGRIAKAEREKVLIAELKEGDLVVVKTSRGNVCAEFLSHDTYRGFLCKKKEQPQYVYRNKKWVVNSKFNPKYDDWESRAEFYVSNSVVGRFYIDNGVLKVERFK